MPVANTLQMMHEHGAISNITVYICFAISFIGLLVLIIIEIIDRMKGR